jgi:titin
VSLIVPAVSTNLTAGVAKNGQVNLNWQDKSNNETGFQIERSPNGTAFTVIAAVGANTINYKDGNARQTYYYRVAAKNNVGLSSYSNVVTTH